MPAPGWPAHLAFESVHLVPIGPIVGLRLAHAYERNRPWLAPWEAATDDAVAPRTSAARRWAFARHFGQSGCEARRGTAMPWAIEVDGEVAGHVAVTRIARGEVCSASIGYWVDEAHTGRGIAPAAVALAFDHAVGPGGLHRVEAAIHPDNARSLAVVAKLGFRPEGVRQRYLMVRGTWTDHKIFALTSEDVPDGLLSRWAGRPGLSAGSAGGAVTGPPVGPADR
jgi:ribosomal-protein-alanine N-acetyltransferase